MPSNSETRLILGELFEAIEQRNIVKINQIAASGFDLNQYKTNPWGTPLHKAVSRSYPEIVSALLKAGAYPHGGLLSHFDWWYPGEKYLDWFTILELLIQANIDLNYRMEENYTILMRAASAGTLDVVKLLVTSGADVNLIDRTGDCALTNAARREKKEVYDYLFPLTFRVFQIKAQKQLPPKTKRKTRKKDLLAQSFIDAAGWGNLKDVLSAIASGVFLDAFDAQGDTALYAAARRASTEVVSALIDAGADVNKGDESSDMTPLTIAAADIFYAIYYNAVKTEQDYIKIIRKLIEAGADVNKPDNTGFNPLMAAAHSGSVEAVYILLQAGADVNAKDHRNDTALIRGAHSGSVEVIKELLYAGADVHATDNSGFNALMAAASSGSVEGIEVLLQAGADVNAQDDGNNTALILASQANNILAVLMLLEAGALVNLKNNKGKTALSYALIAKNQEIIQLLQQARACVDQAN